MTPLSVPPPLTSLASLWSNQSSGHFTQLWGEERRGVDLELLVISSPVWNDSLTFWISGFMRNTPVDATFSVQVDCSCNWECYPWCVPAARCFFQQAIKPWWLARAESVPKQKSDAAEVIKVTQRSSWLCSAWDSYFHLLSCETSASNHSLPNGPVWPVDRLCVSAELFPAAALYISSLLLLLLLPLLPLLLLLCC